MVIYQQLLLSVVVLRAAQLCYSYHDFPPLPPRIIHHRPFLRRHRCFTCSSRSAFHLECTSTTTLHRRREKTTSLLSASVDPREEGEEEDPFTTLERTNWQRGFEAYDIGFGPLTRKAIPTLLGEAGFPPSETISSSSKEGQGKTEFRVLDVATGPGYVLSEAIALEEQTQTQTQQQYDYRYAAFDISTNFLNLARSNLKENLDKIEFVEGDASKPFPFRDNTFDCITCNFGILHLSDPESFLKECQRILKPNSKMSYSVWAEPPATEGFYLILKALQRAGGTDVSESLPEGPPFFRFAQKEEILKSMKESAGFDDISINTQLNALEWETIQSSEQLYNVLLEGTARTRELLIRQTPSQTVAIKAELKQAWKETTNNGSRFLKMPVVVVSGTKKIN